MELSQILPYIPFIVGIACAAAIYFKTKNSCDKTIGKVPVIGKVCKTKFVKWIVALSALLCGSSGIVILRAIFG